MPLHQTGHEGSGDYYQGENTLVSCEVTEQKCDFGGANRFDDTPDRTQDMASCRAARGLVKCSFCQKENHLAFEQENHKTASDTPICPGWMYDYQEHSFICRFVLPGPLVGC